MGTVIQVEGLSKKYILSHQKKEKYYTFRDVMADAVKNLGRKVLSPFSSRSQHSVLGATREEFWALRDVSFEIKEGDRVGIIGRNGAGKSTLLKILSRITEPTKGRVSIHGRVASLLEVGTGFHPELTGRENIYLNGAILGMSKVEIKRKFDEIVAFAEVENFLDTPVKRYSSGMYVRLAFAVAAHLEPEILIVDEVLAVGDVQFQKKCLGKMEQVASDGKTVLLVSHNMATIQSLSINCIFLAKGQLMQQGLPRDVISAYQNSVSDKTYGQTDLMGVDRYGTGKARFTSVVMRPLTKKGEILPFAETGCDLEFEIKIHAYDDIESTTVALLIYDELGTRLIDVNTLIKGTAVSIEKKHSSIVRFTLKDVRLKPDIYVVRLWMGIPNDTDIDGIPYATSFRMEAREKDILYTAPFPGVYACEFEHQILSMQ